MLTCAFPETSEQLSQALTQLQQEGPKAQPVCFGTQHHPIAVLLPFETYEWFLAQERIRAVEAAENSVLAEVPGEFSQTYRTAVDAYVRGEITAREAHKRVLEHYQIPSS